MGPTGGLGTGKEREMLILVSKDPSERATIRTDDFTCTNADEVLTLGSVCDGGPRHTQKCGCGRAFVGLDTAKATTFGLVAEMDDGQLRQMVYESKFVDGWTFEDNRQETADMVMDDLGLISKCLSDMGAEMGEEVRVKNAARTFTLSLHGTAKVAA